MSTMTDARVHSNYVIQTGEVPVRHTHEEYMDVSPPAFRPAALIETMDIVQCPSTRRYSSWEGVLSRHAPAMSRRPRTRPLIARLLQAEAPAQPPELACTNQL